MGPDKMSGLERIPVYRRFFKSIIIRNLTHYDSAPESRPLLTENIRDVDVERALNFVEVRY